MAGGEFAGVDLAVMPETACLRGSRKVERNTTMKKLMFAVVAAAAGLVYGLESSNTVGYQQYALDTSDPNDYIHNIGIQFKNVGATESYTITDTIFGVPLTSGDQFFIFDPVYFGYTLYEYAEITSGQMGFTVMYADGTWGENVFSLTVNKGDNILYTPVDPTVTPNVSGEVQASGTATLTFTVSGDDYIFPITNPFPKSTTLADLTCLEVGDQFFVWDSVYFGYTLLEYAEITTGVFGLTVMFADGSWGDPITDPAAVIFPVGQGGLYVPGDSRTWTVTFNY